MFHVQIDPLDSRVLFYFASNHDSHDGYMAFDEDNIPGWDDATQLLVGQVWTGTQFIPTPGVVPPSHRKQMNGAEFISLFTPAEYRQIKQLRNGTGHNSEVVDHFFDLAEIYNSVNMDLAEYAIVEQALLNAGTIGSTRMQEISLGWPFSRPAL